MDRKLIIIYAIVVFCAYTAIANINLDIYEKSAKVTNRESLSEEIENEVLSRTKRQLMVDDHNYTFVDNNTILVKLNFSDPIQQSVIDELQEEIRRVFAILYPNYTVEFQVEAEIVTTTSSATETTSPSIDDFDYTIFDDNNTILVKLNVSDPIQQSVIYERQEEIRGAIALLYPNYTVEFQVEAEIITSTSSATETTSPSTVPFTTFPYSSEGPATIVAGTQTTPETDQFTTTNPGTTNFISTTPLAIETTHGEGSGETTTHITTDAVKASETYSMGTIDSHTTTDTEGSSSGDVSTMSDETPTTNSLTTADLRTSATGVTPSTTMSEAMTTALFDAMTTTMSDVMTNAVTTTMSDAMSTTVSNAMVTTISGVMPTTAPAMTTMMSGVMSTSAPDIMSTAMPDIMTTNSEDTSVTMSVAESTYSDPTSRSMTSAEQSTSLPTIAEESTALSATSDAMSSTQELSTNEVTSSGETSAESTVVTDEDVVTTSDSFTTEEVSAEPTVTTETYEAKNFTFHIELENKTFTPNLLNSSSPEYQTLEVTVETTLENVLTLSSIRKIEVDGFKEGSVIAVVNIEADESVTEEDIINDYQTSNSTEKSFFASSGLRSIDTPTTSTPTPSNEVTTTPVTTTTAKAKSQPLSDGAIVGIVLGSLFGTTIIIALIVFVVRRYHLCFSAKSEYDMRDKDYGQMPGLDELYHQSSAEEAV